MAEFAYLAIDAKGREKRGRLNAVDDLGARASLEARQFYVVRLAPGGGASATARRGPSLLSRRGRTLSAKQLTLFTRQFATISQVSPLEEALRTIARQSEQDHVRAIVARVADGVVVGSAIVELIAQHRENAPSRVEAFVASLRRAMDGARQPEEIPQ